MSWEMAWLNYKEKEIDKEIKFLGNIYTDLSGEIINNSMPFQIINRIICSA